MSGQTAYLRYCAWCHGERGDGRGPSAHRFDNAATNFTLGIYKCRSTPGGSLPTDADLRRSVQQGLEGTGMPSFVALGPLEMDGLIEVLKSASPRFRSGPAGEAISVPKEPANDPASIQRGAAAYARLQCTNCHGADGYGGQAAGTLKNDNGSPARVSVIAERHALKCGSSPERIYTSLMAGLDGTPMAGYAETVSPEEAWDVTHFVMSLQ